MSDLFIPWLGNSLLPFTTEASTTSAGGSYIGVVFWLAAPLLLAVASFLLAFAIDLVWSRRGSIRRGQRSGNSDEAE